MVRERTLNSSGNVLKNLVTNDMNEEIEFQTSEAKPVTLSTMSVN